MKLYEIANELAQLTQAEELPPDLEKQLDELALSLDAKVDACCRLIREEESEATRFRDEAKRLTEIAKKAATKADRLRDYVRDCLTLAGVPRLETELFRLRIQDNPPSAVCEGEPVPAFARTKVEWDKAALLGAWRDGLPLPAGVSIVVGKSLRVV